MTDSLTTSCTQQRTFIAHPWSHGNHLSHATQSHFNSSGQSYAKHVGVHHRSLGQKTSLGCWNNATVRLNRIESKSVISRHCSSLAKLSKDYTKLTTSGYTRPWRLINWPKIAIFANQLNTLQNWNLWKEPLFHNCYISNHWGLAESSEMGELSKSTSLR